MAIYCGGIYPVLSILQITLPFSFSGFLLRSRVAILLLLALLTPTTLLAVPDEAPVRMGVLAFRTLEQTASQWAPTARYLSEALSGRPVTIVPLSLETIEPAVANARIDFLLANPEQYVVLAYRYRLAAVATLMPESAGRPLSRFGGVIFTRNERSDIVRLADVAGKTVAAASDKSFAGFLAQQWTLQQAGVDVRNDGLPLVLTGLPQDKVVHEVLAGRADVGFVRTGVLEAMESEGKLPVGAVRVVNAQTVAAFPQHLSTELYPEWPLAAMPDVPESLIKAVTVALYRLPPGHPASRVGAYYGFAPPGDYTSVEALLHRLHLHPERLQHFGTAEIVQKYAMPLLLLVLLGFAGLAAALSLFIAQNRRLKNALARAERLALRDDLLTGLSEGVYGIDLQGKCTFVNRAATQILGFAPEEVVGEDQHRLFHHHHDDGREYLAADCPLHLAMMDGQARDTEEVFFRKDGSKVQVRLGVQPIWSEGKVQGAVVAFQDISAQKAAERQIREMALHDALTGLPNRRLLSDRLQHALTRAERTGTYVAVLFLDLDGFKPVNDHFGHDAGDAVLIAVSRRLESSVRAVDTVARLAGDEFVVVLADLPKKEDAEVVAGKLVQALSDPIAESNRVHQVSASIGLALSPVHGKDVETLLRVADAGMYVAKREGKQCWRWGA